MIINTIISVYIFHIAIALKKMEFIKINNELK